MSQRKQLSSRGWAGTFVATALTVAVALVLALNSRTLADSFNYYRYQPSTAIESFVSQAGMSDRGKYIFYASHPSLETAASFNSVCDRAEEMTAILGCYNGQNIYIYDIPDERLMGIRATTAAHEMLHAAYVRLPEGEKIRINRLLENEFEKLRNDETMSERMAYYARTEPGERYNELHSIIGTEILSISTELESHYRQYFIDRSKVVALHTQYEALFTSLKSRADELNKRLQDISADIERKTQEYNEEAESVQADIRDFNDKADSGSFSSNAEFMAERRVLVARVAVLDRLREEINLLSAEYDRLATELNGIATQTEDLNRSIDSNLAAPPSL